MVELESEARKYKNGASEGEVPGEGYGNLLATSAHSSCCCVLLSE